MTRRRTYLIPAVTCCLLVSLIAPMRAARKPALPSAVHFPCPACGTGLSVGRVLREESKTEVSQTTNVDTTGMVAIPSGTFWMGSDDPRFPDAGPSHQVHVNGFWMDKTDVTNAEFERFVAATGYVTVAEKKPDPATVPGVAAELLVAGAVAFTKPMGPVALNDPSQWWRYVPGANWRHPDGPSSDLLERAHHPVVDIAWADAVAYATWAGKRLPTEAQWEYAARGGLDRNPYVWGTEFRPAGKFMANTFQGSFPFENTAEDGYAGTSPVGSFPANGYGLFDMAGNVWQWCSDWYRPGFDGDGILTNPQGPGSGYDPDEPQVAKRVMKGGSFLCTDQYCGRFMPGSRGKGDPDTPLNHVGFRCVSRVKLDQ